MTNIESLTDSNFNEVVQESDQLVVVDFWAEWCGPCRKISPILEDLAQEWEGKAKVVKVNIDEASATAMQQQIMSIPTIKVFKNGKDVATLVGTNGKAMIKTLVDSYF